MRRERLLLSSPPIGPADTTFTLQIEANGVRWEREACAGYRDRLRQTERILTSINVHRVTFDRYATTVGFLLVTTTRVMIPPLVIMRREYLGNSEDRR